MKKIILPFVFLSISAFSQNNKEVTEKGGSKKLLGQISREMLSKPPYNEWYQPQLESYIVESQKLKPFTEKLNKVSVKVFLGTWCGDTKREVPRFLKTLDSQGFNDKNLQLICLDNGGNNAYKQSPEHEEKGMSILRVPTFIFYEEGKEIGRIVESPIVSFEQDIVNILNKNRTVTNYHIGTYAMQLMEKGYSNYIEEHAVELSDEWRNQLKNSGELNAVGYVLFDQKKAKEALILLNLNAKLFPNVPNVYDSLAEAYEKSGNKELAILNYKKVLELSPKAENAIEKLKELQK